MNLLPLHTSADLQQLLASFIRTRRKALKWSRDELAARSTVPAPTIKRFELTGEISLRQLLLLWQCVADLEDLAALCRKPAIKTPQTIEEILQS